MCFRCFKIIPKPCWKQLAFRQDFWYNINVLVWGLQLNSILHIRVRRRLSAGQCLRHANENAAASETALNCRQQISVKDSFDFEFQSRLHECEAITAKGISLSFCGKSVRICVPAFFVARKPVTTEWPAGWDMILPRPLVWTERAKRRCGETPGQEQKNDIQADRQKMICSLRWRCPQE